MRPRSRRPYVPSALLLGLVSCTGIMEDPEDLTPASAHATLRAPERATWKPVADVLQRSCGTLDCHGQVGRGLRLYGGRGLRLDPKGNSADAPTSVAEYDQSYWSVVGLEPEILSAVVHDGGRLPERLTMVRKARGLEKHKGGTLFMAGDAQDRCLLSWIAGALEKAACDEVLHPGGDAE